MSPMTLEQLKGRMADNREFQDYLKWQESRSGRKILGDVALLRAYQGYLLEHLGDVRGQLMDESDLRLSLVLALHFNPLFQQEFRAGSPTLAQRYDKETAVQSSGPVNELMAQVFKQYAAWLTRELDDTMFRLEEAGTDEVLQYEKRRALELRFGKLFDRELRLAKEEGYTLQLAVQEKEQTKKEVMEFLSQDASSRVTRFNWAIFGNSDKTSAGIDLLNREITRCNRVSGIMRAMLPRYAARPKSREILETQVALAESRRTEAEHYIARLKECKRVKKQARISWQEKTAESEALLKQTDVELLGVSEDLLRGVRQVVPSLREQEAQIGTRLKELEKTVREIPRLYEEQEKQTNELVRIESILAGDPIRLKYLGNLGFKAGSLPALRRSIAERARLIEETELRQRHLSEDLAFLNAKYNAMFDRTEAALNDQQELNRLRAKAHDELQWLQSLPRIHRALNVYCSTATVTFELFLSIGQIAAGRACGPVGGTAVAAMGIAGMPITYGLSLPLSGALLTNIQPYDTGQLGISLKLGFSWGADFQPATKDSLEASVGMAIVYDASLQVSDTRGFSTVSTITLATTAEAAIPGALRAAIEMELIKEKRVMTFKDVYHWAAWIGQKWANLRAWAVAARLYRGGGTSQPTAEDLKRLREVADISLKNDKPTRDMLEKVFKYMGEPILRTECKELFPHIGAEISAAEFFTLKGARERRSEPKFIRRNSDIKTGEVYDEERKGDQWSRSLTVGAGIQVQADYSNVEKDPNPDNVGESLTFTISLPIFDQNAQWISTPAMDPSKGAIGTWVQSHLAPAANKISNFTNPGVFNLFKSSLATNPFLSLSTGLALGTVQVALFLSTLTKRPAPDGKTGKWVLFYWRPVFSTATEIQRTVPLGYGFNMVLGGSVSLSRTYREQLGDNTIVYLQIVYNGLMNISLPGDDGNPRPPEARGPALWKEYVDTQKKTIWRMMHNITLPHTWIAAEVNDREGGAKLIADLKRIMPAPARRSSKGLPSQHKAPYVDVDAPESYPDFSQTLFDKAFDPFQKHLEDFRKSDYLTHKNKDWHRIPIQGGTFNWSMNPIVIAGELYRTHTTQYKLEKGVVDARTALGHRKGASQQVLADVKMVPDEQAPNCMLCGVAFSFIRRRHHCRECGKVFCADCSSHSIELPHRSQFKPVRVCNTCYARLTAAPKQPAQAPSGHKDPGAADHGEPLPRVQDPVSQPHREGFPAATHSPVSHPQKTGMLTSAYVSSQVPGKESLLTSSRRSPEAPRGESPLSSSGSNLGALRGDSGRAQAPVVRGGEVRSEWGEGKDEITVLDEMEHERWWSTRIARPVPSSADRQAYIDFAVSDAQAAQAMREESPASREAQKSKGKISPGGRSSRLKGVTVAEEGRNPLVGKELTNYFDITDVSADGNCLFRSMAVALQRPENQHKAYRRLAVEHIFRHTADFETVYQGNVPAYLYSMSETARYPEDKARWGGSPEILALSRILKREIIVYACTFDSPTAWELNRTVLFVQQHAMGDGPFKPPREAVPIYIANQGGNHYVCLKPKARR